MSEMALEIIRKAKETRAKSIDLGKCGLTEIPEELFELTWLEELSFSDEYFDYSTKKNIESKNSHKSNFISYIQPSIKYLKCLKKLIISGGLVNPWEIINIDYLGELSGLRWLNINNNNINDPSVLKNLIKLKILELDHNQINDLRFLSKLKYLSNLQLGSNNISSIDDLPTLPSLFYLNLSNNQIEDLRTLSKNVRINWLSLYNNYISELDPLRELKELSYLSLGGNKLKNIAAIAELRKLKELDLNSNYISNISSLCKLNNLKALFLGANNIDSIDELSRLINLEILLIDNNHITNISSLVNLKKLKWLDLRDNPLKYPPAEIASQGIKTIRLYFKEKETQGSDFLYEAKLLIVGEPGAGKSSLKVKLKDPDAPLPRQQKITKGIDIDSFSFRTAEKKNFRVNVWDFGGQEIYHSIHHFFLTHRSLYILLDDAREIRTDFNYWLLAVEAYSKNSPLLIVQNQKGDMERDLDMPKFRERFPNIKDFIPSNLLSRRGLPDIHKAIKYYIQTVGSAGLEMPKQWVKIRKEIAKIAESNDCLSISEYFKLCARYKIPEEERALFLSETLHDLGVFLHFKDNPVLYNTIFLKSSYITEAVFCVVNDKKVKQNKGRFSKNDFPRFWKAVKFRSRHHELIELMKAFELCYETDSPKGKVYIYPLYLPGNRPSDYEMPVNIQRVIVKYKYTFLPKGHFSRFIVRMHKYLKNDWLWRSGIVIGIDGTLAEVSEDYEHKEISICVHGDDTLKLLHIIMFELDDLNSDMAGVEKQVPCVCEECEKAPMPYFFPFNKIELAGKKRVNDLQCQVSFNNVSRTKLLAGVGIYDEDQLFKPRIKIFISYAHEDAAYKDKLKKFLAGPERLGEIFIWTDNEIETGEKWNNEILTNLKDSHIIIFLISQNMVASNYINEVELKEAIQIASNGRVAIVPVLITPSDWDSLPLKQYQALPNDLRPVSKWENEDEAYMNILTGIKKVIAGKKKRQSDSDKVNY